MHSAGGDKRGLARVGLHRGWMRRGREKTLLASLLTSPDPTNQKERSQAAGCAPFVMDSDRHYAPVLDARKCRRSNGTPSSSLNAGLCGRGCWECWGTPIPQLIQPKYLNRVLPRPLRDPLKRHALVHPMQNPRNSPDPAWLIPPFDRLSVNEPLWFGIGWEI